MISQQPSRYLFLGIVFACIAANAYALDPNRLPSQYVYQQWIVGSSFPGSAINTIAQTADGYLWIGTDRGLVRFDGFTFSPVSFTPVASASDIPILQLLTDADGHLWIRPEGADVVHQDNGRFESVEYGAMVQTSQITAMAKDSNGRIIVSDIARGTFRFQGSKVEQLAQPAVLSGSASPPVISMAQGSDGRLWMGTLGVGLFSFAAGRATRFNAGLPDRKINCLLLISKDELWVGTDTGLYRWNGKELHRIDLPSTLGSVQVLSILRDRDSNIWAGTTRGLLRINSNGTAFSAEDTIRGQGGINALFEDREGNLWVGGSQGLGRIRNSTFLSYSPAIDPRFEHDGPVDVDGEGRTWFAPEQGGLYAMKNGRIQSIQTGIPADDVIYSISSEGDDLWVGRQRGGLTKLQFRNGAVTSMTYTQANGLAQNSVYTVYQSHDGSVWAGTLSGGVSRFKDQRFTHYTMANGLASNTISSILETRNGEMWFATAGGLNSLSNGQWRTFTTRDGLPSERVNCLFEDSSGTLWIGTAAGLAASVTDRFQVPAEWPEQLRDPVFGIAEDKRGWLWIATSTHVLQVRRDKLAKGILGASDLREYGTADGLLSSDGINRSRSVVADSDGRIWFSLGHGISVVDPSHMPNDSPPAIVHIEAVLADDLSLSITNRVRVPPSPKRIVFAYTALSLASPERIRFRYFLDGFDRNWSAPLAAREAVYTNLRPGSYRFRVVASNSSGLWNGAESAIEVHVEPAVWQTWWFRSALVVLVACVSLLFYRLRLLQLTHQLNLRFEERLAERTRIARELHDTLLQSFQGVAFQLQAARKLLLRKADNATAVLDEAILGTEEAIQEGRSAIRDLRPEPAAQRSLPELLNAISRELATAHGRDGNAPSYGVVIEGKQQDLSPILQDELYRISREVIRNAFAHAAASNIEVEIRYGQDKLRLRFRDDGKGIDPKILQAGGQSGHFGIPGMRERAQRIGARLDFWSEMGAGTEVELTVPGSMAYPKPHRGRRFGLFNWARRGR
ncbi:MAG TPA: two-component regulator propeller domain-containing protein [Terracidiphilus sp.]|nr:two-component regulator propeller domain-containing protein [Terracidiphilus sp.]